MSPDIPEQQWAQVYEKSGAALEAKQVPVRRPGPDEVLVNIKFSGVCHTDLNVWKGGFSAIGPSPVIGGHEGAGVVVAKGELVKDIEIGEQVGIKFLNRSCLSCEFCEDADEVGCLKGTYSGVTVDGCFQQYTIVQAAQVARIHKDIPLDSVAPVLCAGLTAYRALKECGARPGQTVAVVGAAGGLGSLAIQYAKAMGLQVIAVDSGDEKKQLCEKYGANTFVDFATSEDLAKDVKGTTADGLGPHAVLLIASNEKSINQGISYVRPRGTLITVGLPPGGVMHTPILPMVMKKITIKGSLVGNRRDMAEALDFVKRGLVECPVKIVGLSELPKVFELMEAGKIVGRYVLDTSK
ncbi:MAG: alcohol dehydrogenase [Watsoniomyces obsoletus]|nr:MAG: alcohol dehydrogenase [Watsoniomyces obsoletus]